MLLSSMATRCGCHGPVEERAICADWGIERCRARELNAPHKALAKARWAGVVDSVGGLVPPTPAQRSEAGAQWAACGNAGAWNCPSRCALHSQGRDTLRIDSNHAPSTEREAVGPCWPGISRRNGCRCVAGNWTWRDHPDGG